MVPLMSRHCFSGAHQSLVKMQRANNRSSRLVLAILTTQHIGYYSELDRVSTWSNSGVRGQWIQPDSIGVEPDDVINKNYLKIKILYVKYLITC